jgi:DNA-binding MarR family transcriptional regulator
VAGRREHVEPLADGAFPDDVLSALLGRLVRSGGLREAHDHADLHASLSETLALRHLLGSSDLAQGELAECLGLEKSTVSRLVAGLERRGWVSRRRDPENRRFIRLSLTIAGEEAARRIGAHLHEQHQALLDGLTPDELRALTVGLTALARVIADGHRSGE